MSTVEKVTKVGSINIYSNHSFLISCSDSSAEYGVVKIHLDNNRHKLAECGADKEYKRT